MPYRRRTGDRSGRVQEAVAPDVRDRVLQIGRMPGSDADAPLSIALWLRWNIVIPCATLESAVSLGDGVRVCGVHRPATDTLLRLSITAGEGGTSILRALIILGVIQVGLLILMFNRLTALDGRLAAQPPTSSPSPVSNISPSPPAGVRSDDAFWSSDEARLRQIIREELRAQPASDANSDQPVAGTGTFNPDAVPENRIQLDRVSQKIDYFSSIGHISEDEMGDLEMEIAKLDPAGRRDMLRKLTQALNSGAIEGRF